MTSLVLIAMASAVGFGQYVPLTEGMMRYERLKAAKAANDRTQIENDLLRQQKRLLELQVQREQELRERENAQQSDRQFSTGELQSAAKALSAKYADFPNAIDQMVNIEKELIQRKLTAEQYLEIFYLAAKLASFSPLRQQEMAKERDRILEVLPTMADASSRARANLASAMDSILALDQSIQNSPAVLNAALRLAFLESITRGAKIE